MVEQNRGFTLVELMVVISILGFLAFVSAGTVFDTSGWLAHNRLKSASKHPSIYFLTISPSFPRRPMGVNLRSGSGFGFVDRLLCRAIMAPLKNHNNRIPARFELSAPGYGCLCKSRTETIPQAAFQT
jgi:prepilin-type N-terminal cleavage/methylation domain-containing protein